MRTVNTEILIQNIKEMCIEANHYLSEDMDEAMKKAVSTEKSELGKKILNQLQENLKIADEDMIPICQDTGMAVIFLEIGQDVHLEGMAVGDAVNEGVRRGYTEGFLRKSVVGDPLIRENTKDNTPAVIHYDIVPGDKIKITVAPKGFGSENMSRIFMLKPADGAEGVKEAILTAVKDAGPNACPPMVIGVGIGGTFEKCALMAKEALTRQAGSHADIPWVRELEEEFVAKPSDALVQRFHQLSRAGQVSYETVHELTDQLQEDEPARGAYYCSYPSFIDVYRTCSRMLERTGQSAYLLLYWLTDSHGQVLEDAQKAAQAAPKLKTAISCSLRRGDVFTQYGRDRFLVILMGTNRENCDLVDRRIVRKYKEDAAWGVSFRHTLHAVGTAELDLDDSRIWRPIEE